jgi:hypothetical protein
LRPTEGKYGSLKGAWSSNLGEPEGRARDESYGSS